MKKETYIDCLRQLEEAASTDGLQYPEGSFETSMYNDMLAHIVKAIETAKRLPIFGPSS